MSQPYVSQRRVEFRDTDAAGIMHFSTFFTYMEEVEHEFLRSLGTSVVTPLETSPATPQSDSVPAGGKISWPRVAAECQYRGSARFEDQLTIALRVERLGTSSVTYAFDFHVVDQQIAHGSLTTVCCKIFPDRPPEAMPIPAALRQQLSARVTP